MMNTQKGYKMFRLKDGKLFPLYVLANKETPLGEWVEAEEGCRGDGKLFDKVKSKLGWLAYRPGWHIAEIPNSPWIGKKENGELVRRSDNVWCEVEYCTDKNYQPEARENGWRAGKWASQRAYLKHIPVGGYYKFRTNTNGDVWIISGEIKVNRILSDEEVNRICRENGVIPQRTESEVVA